MRRGKIRSRIGAAVRMSVLLALLLVALFPVYFLIATSLKSDGGFAANYFGLPLHDIQWKNFSLAWKEVHPYIWNSMKVSTGTVLLTLLVVVPAAYVFSWHRFPGKERIFTFALTSLMVPSVLTIIPSYVLTRDLGLLDNHWGIILPGVAGNIAVSMYLLRTFFRALPSELIEAARIDGASEPRVLLSIVGPLATPSMTTVAVLVFIAMWNAYLWPATVISTTSKQLASVAVTQLAGDPLLSTVPLQLAGYLITIVPLVLVFAFLLRFFVRGVSMGAVKG